MKNFVLRLLLLAVVVVGFGFYRGWFTMSRPASEPGTGKVNVTLGTDPGKLNDDVQTVKDKARSLTGEPAADGVAGEQPVGAVEINNR